MVSILWNNLQEESVLLDTVFTDLKISKLLENIFDSYQDIDEMIDVISKIPNKETIVYRQEILTDILEDDNLEFTKLYHELFNIVGLYYNLQNANELIRRQILFLIYLYNYYNFCNNVVLSIDRIEAKAKGLLDIKEKIVKLLTDNKKFIDNINKIYNNIVSTLNFNAMYKDGAPYVQVSFNKPRSLEEDLLDIMDSFGIKQNKYPKAASRKEINLQFLKEIVLNNIDIYTPIKDIYENYKSLDYLDLKEVLSELRFYLNIKALFNHLKTKGVKICKANFSDNKETFIKNSYDITLTISNKEIIPNDFVINNKQNVIFLLGVNSGGKTCYLRSSSLSYLFALITGYSFSESALIHPVKYFYTHFPNEENYGVGEGRLRDEIRRIDAMKENFGEDTICFCNETFSSTSEEKACNLTFDLLNDLLSSNTKMLFVTHQYQVFEKIHNEKVVYLAPVVDEENNNKRTHKIKKVEKGLLSYANDILVKYGLSKKDLEERVRGIKNE